MVQLTEPLNLEKAKDEGHPANHIVAVDGTSGEVIEITETIYKPFPSTSQQVSCADTRLIRLKRRYRNNLSPVSIYLVLRACQAASMSAYRFFSEGLPVLTP